MARSKQSLDIDLRPGLPAKAGAARKNALKNKASDKRNASNFTMEVETETEAMDVDVCEEE
jgi:hypothetical protein